MWKLINELDGNLINTFKCSDEPSVEKYFKEDAITNDSTFFTTTKVLLNSDESKVIGYYSLFNEFVMVSDDRKKKFAVPFWGEISNFPSVRLHYLGVSDEYRRQGFGDKLLGMVFSEVVDLTKRSGCMFISVEAINDRAIEFNKKNGFKIYSNRKGKRLPSEKEIMLFKISELIS